MIDKIINSQRIKYSVLNELFTEEILKDNDTVNIYFDMHTVIHNLYRSNAAQVDIMLNNHHVVELVTSILNLAAHYRRYFNKYHKKNNRIFFILNKKIPTYNSQEIPYGHIFFDRYSSQNINYDTVNYVYDKMLIPLREIVKGFKWIYLIESKQIEDHATIKFLADSHDGLNIVITKSELLYQLVNDGFLIFRPSFEQSVLLNKDNILNYYFQESKYKSEYLTAQILPIFQTILGIRERNIDSLNIRGKVKLAKIFDRMIEARLISNTVSIKTFIDVFMGIYGTDDSDFYDTLYFRYCAISASMSYLALTATDKQRIMSCIIDTYHDNSITDFNENLLYKDKMDVEALNRATAKRRGLFD